MATRNLKPPGPQAAVNQFFDALPECARVLIGYSGGLDSHVLLHAAQQALERRPDVVLGAVHVDHGLQDESKAWAEHCRQICAQLGVDLKVVDADVPIQYAESVARNGLEAAAREARYQAYSDKMRAGDFVLLAQHMDDQAETFLLQALRGSGPDGLSAMQPRRKFAEGLLCRPLLTCARKELEKHASRYKLAYVTDGSNADTRFDRNFLRHEIMPLLAQRWSASNQTLSRAASRCHAASNLLLGLAATDLVGAKQDGVAELDTDRLLELPLERRFNALRLWVRHRGYRLPSLKMLRQVESDLLQSAAEAGVVGCPEYEFRRYRKTLYLMDPRPQQASAFDYPWPAHQPTLSIPELDVELQRADLERQGIDLPAGAQVSVRSRRGGELIPVGNPVIHKSIKKLLQEAQVPPWQRSSYPLIYVNDELAAVWQLAVAARFSVSSRNDSVVTGREEAAQLDQPVA